MANQPEQGMKEDLSALAWVSDEVRRSLEAALTALRRCLKEVESAGASDLSTVDPSALRQVRAQIHQSVGALELVGMGFAAQPLRAAEAAVHRLASKTSLITPAAVKTIERCAYALLDFLTRKLAGKSVSPLSMFPQYRAVQELAGATRAHPADLWAHEWQWRTVPADGRPTAAPRASDASAIGQFEIEMLAIMRGRPSAAERLCDLCDGLAMGVQGNLTSLWQLAAAFFEAQTDGLLSFDLHAKRVASRLLAQLRAGAQGQASDRLAQDLLFFCAQVAPTDDHPAGPRLEAVREAYGLVDETPVDYQASQLGQFDPALLALARKRVSAAKEVWSAVASGDLARLPGLAEPFSLVGESLGRLYPEGASMAQSLQAVVSHCQAPNASPSPELAMEVATVLLFIEASLDDADFSHPEMPARVRRLAERLDRVRQGQDPGALELWMEELYRRVSDRQTMGNVVHELRASLSEVEKQIDQYFRNPAQREVLIPVPAQLSAMRGVLSLLDLQHASQAVVRMRDDVDALANTEVDPERAIQTGTFDRLADNLGALSFLIDMVSVQPQTAKSLFRFDPSTGMLKATMHRAERPSGFSGFDVLSAEQPALVDQVQNIVDEASRPEADPQMLERELGRLSLQAHAADQTGLAELASRAQTTLARATGADDIEAARQQLADSIQEYVATSETPLPEPTEAPRPVPPPGPPVAPGQTGLEDDAEMREIFLEEAREVVETARGGLDDLRQRPTDLGAMTVVRRAFHTLKGSARMVGLRDFGEAAWACEQLFNARLADSVPADADLRGFSAEVLEHFRRWVDAIESNTAGGFDPAPVVRAADTLRLEQRWLPLALATQAAPVVLPTPAPEPPASPESELAPVQRFGELQFHIPDLPTAADLDLGAGLAPAQPEPVMAGATPVLDLPPLQVPSEPIEAQELTLNLDSAVTPPDVVAALPEGLISLDLDELEAATEVPAQPEVIESFELDLSMLEGLAPPAAPVPADFAPIPAVDGWDVAPDVSPIQHDELAAPEPVVHPQPQFAPVPGAMVPTIAYHREEPDTLPLAAMSPAPESPPATSDEPPAVVEDAEDEPVKVIGDLRVSIPLFNIFLNEADELSRHLCTDMAEWLHELHRPPGDTATVLAHSLAGNSATVGYSELSQLARLLEHSLARANGRTVGRPEDAEVFNAAAEEIRRLLHQFAAGFLVSPDPALMQRLADLEHAPIDEALTADELDLSLDDMAEDVTIIERVSEPEELLLEPEPFAAMAAEPVAAEPIEDDAQHIELPITAEPEPLALPQAVEGVFEQLGQPSLMPFVAQVEASPFGVAVRSDLRSDAQVDELDLEDDLDVEDAIDVELFPIFDEEASELLPQLQTRLRDWARQPSDTASASACLRTLHTLKGGARLAGAMRLGEMAHRLETAIAQLHAGGLADTLAVERLVGKADTLESRLEALRGMDFGTLPSTPAQVPISRVPERASALLPLVPVSVETAERPTTSSGFTPSLAAPAAAAVSPATAAASTPQVAIDWSRFATNVDAEALQATASAGVSSHSAVVRVRAPLLDRLVNHAGEVSITRARIEADVAQMKTALGDLTDNLERLRSQLRDIELQAETQIGTRMEAARAAAQQFDPLEMDRFTRFQELTRMMAESVNDVATVQRGLRRTLQSAEDDLAQQARLTRDLQDDLLRTRMVEFDGLSERLYRVVRQAAKETGKQVRLDISGGNIEIDRGVLDRMTGAFEHLLRNSVVHGVEPPARRAALGKEAVGQIAIGVAQEANEVVIDFRDDGAGLDLRRIQDKAMAMGLLPEGAPASEAELAALIFHAGFSTAEQVTGLAGRGVGMDVVRSDVAAMGGRIETATAADQGTSFRLVLPLTTAVTQVVMMRCGDLVVAVPSTLIEIVRRVPASELRSLYERGVYLHNGVELPFYWLAALLQGSAHGAAGSGRTVPVVVIRSAAQRIVLHVDEVLGNQEVVVKNLGTQLSRLPGLAGMTLLPSGAPALIYNPVALATLYGHSARAATLAALSAARHQADHPSEAVPVNRAPLVLVVDDSLTVRRVTQRLLVREGYRVVVAKDGLEGLERLAEELPAVVLTDIEMPRMDGFDLVRNMRMDAKLTKLPIVMITSRIAQKHRDYAAELGVNHYLGKPYVEEDLLALVAKYTGKSAMA
ncbi:MAG: Hpt domain-containing protein [Ideonella sp.]|nr:Hpt domain-containing protein [Ideonella sp.]